MTPNPSLESRLLLLEEDLDIVLSGLAKFKEDLESLGKVGLDRDRLSSDLSNKVVGLQNEIQSLRSSAPPASPSETWILYADLRDRSDQIYREFLEIVCGVAILARQIDQKICMIAQELVRCALTPPSLTILAARDGHSSNTARLMRIRFSDRAVWTLPLAAHQFAYLLIKDFKEFKQFAADQARRGVPPQEQPAALKLLPSETLARARTAEDERNRWEQLIADCIAIYIVGPCYAASAIVFRFSPVPGFTEKGGEAHDIDRAYVCLEMLRNLNSKSRAGNPYTEFIGWLEGLWQEMLSGTESSYVITEEKKTEFNEFVSNLYEILEYNLPAARYPPVKDKSFMEGGGWSVAQEWARNWYEASQAADARLEVPAGIGPSTRVRDALNAAWLCRFRLPAKAAQVSQVARDVCDAIIAARYQPQDQNLSTAPAPGPMSKTR
jgi:hypothetical protein